MAHSSSSLTIPHIGSSISIINSPSPSPSPAPVDINNNSNTTDSRDHSTSAASSLPVDPSLVIASLIDPSIVPSSAAVSQPEIAVTKQAVSREIARQLLTKKPYIELHIHLDGAMRVSTLYELAIKKKISLPADVHSVADLQRYVTVSPACTSLTEFLKTFSIFIPIVAGDIAALKRIAFEFVEDQAFHGVIYTEARYSPQLLRGEKENGGGIKLSNEEVIDAIHEGFREGMEKFNVLIKSILCCFTSFPEWSNDVVELAKQYKEKDGSVVGIDIAGDEGEFSSEAHIAAFKKAKEYGIHRTAHAGEAGPAKNVYDAITKLHAERIGHGYATIEDGEVWELVKQKDIHLECCLTSSLHTGSVRRFMKRLSRSPSFHDHHDHLPLIHQTATKDLATLFDQNNNNNHNNNNNTGNNNGTGNGNGNGNGNNNGGGGLEIHPSTPCSPSIVYPLHKSSSTLIQSSSKHSSSSHHSSHIPWHPVQYFAGAGLNFSLSTDDPLVSHINLPHEYRRAVTEFHLQISDITTCIWNAARSCFLCDEEKQKLMEKLLVLYVPEKIMEKFSIKIMKKNG